MRWSESEDEMRAILAQRRRGLVLRLVVLVLTALAIAALGFAALRLGGRA
jgi:hypothetical protein